MSSTLIGVYRDEQTAESVARALHDDLGVPDHQLKVREPEDARREVVAEMDAEVAESWSSPGLGAFLTAEQMRGAALFAVAFGALGAVVMILPAIVLFTFAESTITRVLVGMLVGALFGSTVGALLGGGIAMQSTDQPMAAEAGVTVRVEDADARAAEIMERFEPIRLDRWEDGERRETLSTEGPHGVKETLEQFGRNAAEPRHRD
jgi:hypothetical protein